MEVFANQPTIIDTQVVEMSSNVRLTDKNTSNGFLSGFMESSVELPADGLNGDCTIHYSDQHSNCEMKVKLLNGLKEGVGTILKDGVPFIQIEYDHGLPNGLVCQMDASGMMVLRGVLGNGIERGLFLEYDRSQRVVWRGYYRNGARYSKVTRSDELSGYCDERSVATGLLISTAQYDKDLKDKTGRCFEYENGSLKSECVYENGVKKHTVREFVNGKMVVFSSNGEKVYEGVYYGDMKSGFLCHEPMEGMAGFFKEVDSNGQLIAVSQYDETNIYRDGQCFEMEDGKVKRVCLYDNAKLKQLFMEFNGAIMTEYNESGKRVFEGTFKGNMKIGFVRDGYGKEFRVVEEKIKSISESRIQKKHTPHSARETNHPLFSKNEIVEGVWRNGVYITEVIPSSLLFNQLGIEELEIGNNSYDDSSVTELKLT